ncbi:Uncharacterised protein [Mycobacteroides abscessus subsp. abscessus]|nr:Uncharacterised protein [Mycobacteroides abscessus subsp. abscessus]SLL33182.1 Uncharacterised protein [Mycobacteroides abscessus subsp. abscessus]
MAATSKSVTGMLENPNSPLRKWLKEHLPNTVRVQESFRKSVTSPCIVPPIGIPHGTNGSAFEYLLNYLTLEDGDVPECAVVGADVARVEIGCRTAGKREGPPWGSFVRHIHVEAQVRALHVRKIGDYREDDLLELTQICWALALFTEVDRKVPAMETPLRVFQNVEPRTWQDFLQLMPVERVRNDLFALVSASMEVLVPFFERCVGTTSVGVPLEAPISADVDRIIGRTLIEVKALSGRPRADGTRRYGLELPLLYQVVCYALLAQPQYQINEIALFNARYAHLRVWHVNELLCELAGRKTTAEELAPQLISHLMRHEECTRDANRPNRRPRRPLPAGCEPWPTAECVRK